MPTKKPKTVAKLKKEADVWFSRYVRVRDSDLSGMGDCITCGQVKHWKDQQAGHFVSRRVNALRFENENVNLQCLGCNMFKYGEQYLYAKALDLKYGDGTAEGLMNRRFETKKWTVEELEKIIQDCKEYMGDRV